MIVVRLKGRDVSKELDLLKVGDTIMVNGRPRKIVDISGPLDQSPKTKNYKNRLFEFKKVHMSKYKYPNAFYNRWDLFHKYGGVLK